ncbi:MULTISPECIES: hypothetical protein [unclassified Streptomyces]
MLSPGTPALSRTTFRDSDVITEPRASDHPLPPARDRLVPRDGTPVGTRF